jgi:hypothetical protein
VSAWDLIPGGVTENENQIFMERSDSNLNAGASELGKLS